MSLPRTLSILCLLMSTCTCNSMSTSQHAHWTAFIRLGGSGVKQKIIPLPPNSTKLRFTHWSIRENRLEHFHHIVQFPFHHLQIFSGGILGWQLKIFKRVQVLQNYVKHLVGRRIKLDGGHDELLSDQDPMEIFYQSPWFTQSLNTVQISRR